MSEDQPRRENPIHYYLEKMIEEGIEGDDGRKMAEGQFIVNGIGALDGAIRPTDVPGVYEICAMMPRELNNRESVIPMIIAITSTPGFSMLLAIARPADKAFKVLDPKGPPPPDRKILTPDEAAGGTIKLI